MKYPIGIQNFESLRKDGYVYVDKTRHVFNLDNEAKPFKIYNDKIDVFLRNL